MLPAVRWVYKENDKPYFLFGKMKFRDYCPDRLHIKLVLSPLPWPFF